MPLYCDDGAIADITPWTPMPEVKRGDPPTAPQPERDRCQRSACRKRAWQHWTSDPRTWR